MLDFAFGEFFIKTGLKPHEFWELRPVDFERMVKGYAKVNQMEWERFRWLGVHLYKSSGNVKKGTRIKPEDLLSLPLLDKGKPKKPFRRKTPEEIREMMRLHGTLT